MNFEQDWFMRQLESLTEGIAQKLLNKPVRQEQKQQPQLGGDDLLYYRLCELLARYEFCAAEDMLWEHLLPGDIDSLRLAEAFYRKMGEADSRTLEAHGFSRQEVIDGLERAVEYIRTDGVD